MRRKWLWSVPLALLISAGVFIYIVSLPIRLEGYYIDRTGHRVPPQKPDYGKAVADALLQAYEEHGIPKSQLDHYLDDRGHLVLSPNGPASLASENAFPEDVLTCVVGDEGILLDSAGHVLGHVAAPVTLIFEFSEGLAAVATSTTESTDSFDRRTGRPLTTFVQWGFVDKTGTYVIPHAFDSASSFSEGLAAVTTGGKSGYIDKSGSFVIPPKYEGAGKFVDGLARVTLERKMGYIDKSGAFVIAPQYDMAHDFSEGLASVCPYSSDPWLQPNANRNGYIDKSGKFVIAPQFRQAERFSQGLAWVCADDGAEGKWGLIDRSGHFVIRPQYDVAFPFTHGASLVVTYSWRERLHKRFAEWKMDHSEYF